MRQFTSIHDVNDPLALVRKAGYHKANPIQKDFAPGRCMALLFFNPSLRTRLSTQKAAMNLGMDVMVLNVSADSWQIEFGDGTVMDQGTQEHVKEAMAVISQYCDVLGVRTFPSLTNRKLDYEEELLMKIIANATVPVVSLESAIRHPLQSLADMLTIQEQGIKKPKIAVSWAPHPKALPQAVTNSFLEWVKILDAEVVLTHPVGYELSDEFVGDIPVTYDQEAALAGADFVYTKNWSSFTDYGKTISPEHKWMICEDKMKLTNQGRMMHCLPIRRNVVASDAVIDNSLVIEQANNRTWAAQAVIAEIISSL